MTNSIGIDLGTSTSEVAIFRRGKPELLRDIRNSTAGILPSAVAVDVHDALIVGGKASRTLGAVKSAKRSMGTDEMFHLGGKSYRPQEISARILLHLKENVERILGQSVTEAVISVPAAFKDKQRQATIDAGELAGLRVERLINEPTAAALAYGLNNLQNEEHVLVYDLGGGTFDVSLLEMYDGLFEVKATAGEPHLGGDDFDRALAELIAKDIERQTRISIAREVSRPEWVQVIIAAEEAKKELSSQEATTVEFRYLGDKKIDFQLAITRREFDMATRSLVTQTAVKIDQVLKDKSLNKSDVDVVILVGGATRMPAVKAFVSEYFDGRALPEHVPPDEAVALGAAIQAALKSGDLDQSSGMIVTEATGHSLGVAAMEGRGGMLIPGRMSVIIPRQSTIPVERTERYFTVNDQQTSVQIHVYQGEHKDVDRNDPVGQFELRGIPAATAGEESIDISFALDLNGRLKVRAKVVSTGHLAGTFMEYSKERMTDDEKSHAAKDLEDQWRKSKFVTRVEPLIAAAARQLPSLAGTSRAAVEGIVHKLKGALAAEDEEAVDELEKELTDLLFDLQ